MVIVPNVADLDMQLLARVMIHVQSTTSRPNTIVDASDRSVEVAATLDSFEPLSAPTMALTGFAGFP